MLFTLGMFDIKCLHIYSFQQPQIKKTKQNNTLNKHKPFFFLNSQDSFAISVDCTTNDTYGTYFPKGFSSVKHLKYNKIVNVRTEKYTAVNETNFSAAMF